MNLTVYSKNEIFKGMASWGVPKDYADPMYNYLVHGFKPGSFFESVLANDFVGAIRKIHPANTISALKALSGWMGEYLPKEACGAYEAVGRWYAMPEDARRKVLEANHLIYTEKEETWMALKGEPTQAPYLYLHS
jgi:hypothetical protein